MAVPAGPKGGGGRGARAGSTGGGGPPLASSSLRVRPPQPGESTVTRPRVAHQSLSIAVSGFISSSKFFAAIMRLVILEDYDQASEWAAKYICNRIIQFKPTQGRYFTLGLPTGSTPLGCYKKLIEYHKNGDLSFKYVKTFNMDEYVGLPRNHPESYHSYMWNNFFKHIDIDPNNAHILDGNAPDLQVECDAFEKKIEEAGGIDLFVGGMRKCSMVSYD